MSTLNVGVFQTLALAVISIYLGEYLLKKFPIFRKYCIPAAVVGGTLIAIITTILHSLDLITFNFDYKAMNTFFYNVFFAAMGLSASLNLLKRGGKLVLIFSILAAVLAVLQNVLALFVGDAMGMNPLVALMAGSTPLTGGHGNSASFGPVAESMGGVGAVEVAVAAATFGLVAGCIMGGPIGRRLIEKHGLKASDSEIVTHTEAVQNLVSQKRAHTAFFALLIACGIGQTLFFIFKELMPDVKLPIHVMSMFGGIIVRFVLDARKGDHQALYESIDIVGAIALSVFVSLSIITMKLWQLADLAIPLITILALQLVLIYFFVMFITYRMCGKNYDSAVIAVGHTGFGLGAVPVSMATMTSVCSKYGNSKIAFFIVPLIGGFISNITNAIAITFFLNVAKGMM